MISPTLADHKKKTEALLARLLEIPELMENVKDGRPVYPG